jgi:hypothetical protein
MCQIGDIRMFSSIELKGARASANTNTLPDRGQTNVEADVAPAAHL